AGCYAALTFSESTADAARGREATALIVEKAHIKRSGCLAAGVNAINAYIVPGRTPEDYAAYALRDAEGIARRDLLQTMAEGLNKTVEKLASLGLVIQRDANGNYAARGERNLKINGENIKPILAAAVERAPRVSVLNHASVIGYITRDGRILGAYALGVLEPTLYVIAAKMVLCATGGASGLYKPNNPGFSRHKLWYPPFNTGAGYAMGLRAGAELTTLEMRFIALRCKDTIAPTGTLAQGVGAKQINALGEVYEQKYGLTTSQRVHGTVRENLEGRGPCYLRTVGITEAQDADLQRAYLNMAPSQTLKWLESGETPRAANVEIEGTEPYIVGGHTASGYWVDANRETTVRGLFAAGDVAGGCPQKYVSGAFAEGGIAANAALRYLEDGAPTLDMDDAEALRRELDAALNGVSTESVETLEAEMQAVMDEYAGGIGAGYAFSEASLAIATQRLEALSRRAETLAAAGDTQTLTYIFELRERLTLCLAVVAHLGARRETRWHSFAENTDYPERDDGWLKFVNSRLSDGKIVTFFRDMEGNLL
ncbi:MAG: adenylyl-sulfate reductase subunit alpha, partial [Oscillospiraceae bacterium]|nr:adenylyl-sulfate reductase subunit alpha [Oscillospiraceae bacterium]